MALTTYHEFEKDGKRYRFVYDDDYQTRGSYAYETEAETKAAEDEEIEKLRSGDWVVLGMIVSKDCGNAAGQHCHSCNGREELDSLWGIVIENSHKAVEAYAADTGL